MVANQQQRDFKWVTISASSSFTLSVPGQNRGMAVGQIILDTAAARVAIKSLRCEVLWFMVMVDR
jgi:hypothetical protein